MHYDWHQTYEWNYEHTPSPPAKVAETPVPGNWDYCGLPVPSPLGIAAGPLLNGHWILHYAALGFDVLTYKTVRSRYRACYRMPNLQPIAPARIRGGQSEPLPSADEMRGSWAVSFGMPSKPPDLWRADLEATRRALPANKILSVSVVATPEEGWSLDDVAQDFARCAQWAIASGADCVEANFSCPNVASADGQLYHQPAEAGIVAARLREAIGKKPLLIKIGHVPDDSAAAELSRALAPHADALVMVNCIAAKVVDANGQPFFGGQSRGIAGEAIRKAVLEQVRRFTRVLASEKLKLRLVGVGGIATASDVRAHLNAGSHAVQLATAAMIDQQAGLKIRGELAGAS